MTDEMVVHEGFAPLLPVQEIVNRIERIHELMKSGMQDGQDYGKIPGCGDKPSLHKPGAEKLGLLFQLSPEIHETIIDLPGGHREYRVKARLTSRASNAFIGDGVGSCSTMESKYRYREQKRACPTCGQESIIKGKDEYGGGWVCWAKQGGCGAKFADGDESIESQEIGRTENTDPADQWNTVYKMAKKRAIVDGMLTATGASALFTQDVEDMTEMLAGARKLTPEPERPPFNSQDVEPDSEESSQESDLGATPEQLAAAIKSAHERLTGTRENDGRKLRPWFSKIYGEHYDGREPTPKEWGAIERAQIVTWLEGIKPDPPAEQHTEPDTQEAIPDASDPPPDNIKLVTFEDALEIGTGREFSVPALVATAKWESVKSKKDGADIPRYRIQLANPNGQGARDAILWRAEKPDWCEPGAEVVAIIQTGEFHGEVQWTIKNLIRGGD